MAGRGDPPEGTPEGVPGGEEEYRSLVFDESFIEAARIQEFSAQERLEDEEHAAVRSRPDPPSVRGGIAASRQGLILVLLIVVAFGTAIYMGVRNPYNTPDPPSAEPMRATMLPLAPREAVPGETPDVLFEHSPAAQFRSGASGVALPPARGSEHFSESQVLSALTTAKEYVVESSIDPDVLTGGAARSVRLMLSPAQQEQFDESLDDPRADGRHAATSWMVRFDPAKVALADPEVRVSGKFAVREAGSNALEVTADHVFVYAVRAAKGGAGERAEGRASLFTVRRELRMHFDRESLRDHQLSVQQVSTQAGPLPCAADSSDVLTPLLAGQRAKDDGPAGTDPFARGRSSAPMCGVLAPDAQPSPKGAESAES
ncbi:hypothetical protein E0L36_02765 [Streptomyces sp. AJS327]|uniref:SCO2583 family membrane protein n=1 Tax=Streptomyces sp. AJS327 TaxID=2545265 RepID=UPI0015DD9192|nr:hypothetical protein [Streptomyces sp. AJS327]MBA0049856.1 hypothetical protein [Streptomyces sp. AJS327]